MKIPSRQLTTVRKLALIKFTKIEFRAKELANKNKYWNDINCNDCALEFVYEG